MRKWVRWWGIAVFILIIFLVAGIWYLFADRIIANNIEEAGEYFVGAKVEVGKTNLTLIPLGISLIDLKVANPNSPMENLIDVENIRFHLDGKYLFERKVIIKDMVVDGLKFKTERQKSGEIAGAKPLTVNRAIDDFILPLLDISKLKTFIEQEELQSINGLNAVKQDIIRVEEEWKAAYRLIPNMADMQEYRIRTNAIVADVKENSVKGLITHARGIKQLKEEIDRDIDNINLNKKAMEIDIDSLKTKKSRALDFIERDIARLRAKYTPDIRGFKNFSKYIFKDDILRQIEEGLTWYNKLEPLFDYAYKKIKDDYYGTEPIFFDGLDIQFPEHDPKPSFLIELAKLSFEKEIGNMSGKITNFTTQQNISGLPTSINLGGSNLDFAESINFSGLLNHIDADDVKDIISLAIRKQKINSTKYKIIEGWELNISNGSVDRIFDVAINNGKIESKLKLNFIGTSINSNYAGQKNILISTIDSVLAKVSNFYIDIDISGELDSYITKINSNLDNIVDSVVRNIVKSEANKAKIIIDDIINDKKQELIKIVESEIERLTLGMSQIDSILNEAKKILKELP